MRDYKLYLKDILQAIKKIEKYTNRLTFIKLKKDELLIDAIVRTLEIIGEAAKNIPPTIKQRYPDIEWKKIGNSSALRSIRRCHCEPRRGEAIF